MDASDSNISAIQEGEPSYFGDEDVRSTETCARRRKPWCWYLFGLFALLVAVVVLSMTVIRTFLEVHNPEKPNLRIELLTETPVIASGTHARFVANLVNDGPEPITIVLPGDGSESGMRTPIIRWNPPMRIRGRCGNINSLKTKEIVTLNAGESVPLKEWSIGSPTLNEPGRISVTLELENIPDLEWGGIPLGQNSVVAMYRVRRTSRFKAVSNVVEIQVQP